MSRALCRAARLSRLCAAPARGLSSASAAAESPRLRLAGRVLFTGMGGITTGLTAWQLYKRGRKVEMIEERSTRLALAPRELRELVADPAAGSSAADEFARVACEGEFDHARQILLGPRSAPPGSVKQPAGAPAPSGWEVVTPLACADGTRVLVNRGWVPRDAADAVEQPRGRVRLEGVLRQGEPRNRYAQNDAAARRYIWLDLAALAAEAGCAPLLVVAVAPGAEDGAAAAGRGGAATAAAAAGRVAPAPRPLGSFLDFYVTPATHLVYAATWASLSAAAALITLKRFR
jgi:surfeit locus 1 family protein